MLVHCLKHEDKTQGADKQGNFLTNRFAILFPQKVSLHDANCLTGINSIDEKCSLRSLLDKAKLITNLSGLKNVQHYANSLNTIMATRYFALAPCLTENWEKKKRKVIVSNKISGCTS